MVIIGGVAKLYPYPVFTIKNSRTIFYLFAYFLYTPFFFIYFCRFFLINHLLKLICLTIPNKNEKIFLTNPLSCCVMIMTMALPANPGVLNITLLNGSA